MIRLALALAALALVAGCGGDEDEAAGRETTTGPAQTAELRLYFLREGDVWPVRREIDTAGGEGTAAIAALLEGPTAQEEDDLDLSTAIPETDEDVEVTGGPDHAVRRQGMGTHDEKVDPRFVERPEEVEEILVQRRVIRHRHRQRGG